MEIPPCNQWVSSGFSTSSPWRSQRGFKTYYTPCFSYEEGYPENWREPDLEPGVGRILMTTNGTISLRLHNKIRVDMTVDRAIRLINFKVKNLTFKQRT